MLIAGLFRLIPLLVGLIQVVGRRPPVAGRLRRRNGPRWIPGQHVVGQGIAVALPVPVTRSANRTWMFVVALFVLLGEALHAFAQRFSLLRGYLDPYFLGFITRNLRVPVTPFLIEVIHPHLLVLAAARIS